jgi:tRNA/rRNA methyltransferase
LLNFFDHLEEELVRNGFLRNRESRPSMVRNLRSLFQRAQCTEQELRTLHGVVTAFAGPRERGGKAEEILASGVDPPDQARR